MLTTPAPIPLPRGALTVSIDLELLWGIRDKTLTAADLACGAAERQIAERLLDLFRAFDIRATWATVGGLLDANARESVLPGPRDAWYALDVVERIRNDPVAHEIGSHSWAHITFDELDATQARSDLERARAVHRQHGLPFDSFVFPRNRIAHRELLAKVGLRVYRSTDAGALAWCDRRAPPLRPVMNVAEKALALPTAVVLPRRHADGLIEVPSSTLLMSRSGLRRLIRPRAFAHKLRRAVRRAAEHKALFHLWFHPSNFYAAREEQFALLETCLREAAHLRDAGHLDVRTLGDFAALAP